MKKRLIALLVTLIITVTTPVVVVAHDPGTGDPIKPKPQPTRIIIDIDVEDDCY